jgi:DNA-binding SARP family transcriptional activator/tetratricopeptide (TPR) repeat protein
MEVRSGEEVLPLGGVKQRAVLAMLLLQPSRLVPVDRLIDGLWGVRVPVSAVNTLQSYISRLRRALPQQEGDGPMLRGGPLGYAVDVDPAAIDLSEFGELVETGRQKMAAGDVEAGVAMVRRGLSLWRGPALADFSGLPFAEREAPRLEELRLAAVEGVVDADLDRGRHRALVPELERLVTEQPLRERMLGQLMVALYRCGRQGDALRVYRDTRRVLADELGIDPSPALQRLHDRVLAQDPGLDSATAGPPARPTTTSDRSSDLFVGRLPELGVLSAAIRSVHDGQGRLVLVMGEAGGGKTALVQHFVKDTDVPTCWGRCCEDEGAPAFWPWIQVLRCRLGRRGSPDGLSPAGSAEEAPADLADLVTAAGLRRADLPADPGQARFRLFEVVADLLAAERSTPAIIVMEDLHAADTPSLLLLQFLVRQLPDARVLVVATLRPPEQGSTARLAGVLAELVREPATICLELPPLPDEAARVLLERAAGRSVPHEVSTAIQRWAEGNPFFLIEMVRLLMSSGSLDRPVDLADQNLQIPQSIQEMVRRRLVVLSDDAVDVLMTAAVAGRRFGLALLERVGPRAGADIAAAAEAAEAARIIEEVPDGSGDYRFSHPLVRQTLYSWVGGVRRRRLHALMSVALEDVGSAAPHPAQVAHHLIAAASETAAGRAADAAARAADEAMRQYAHEEAVRLYALALNLLERSGVTGRGLVAVLMAMGDAQVLSGEVLAARSTFLRVARLARDLADPVQLGEAALRLGAAFEARAYDLDLVGLLEEALRAVPEDQPALRARLVARLAMARYFVPPLAERARLSDEAVQLARASGDGTALAVALNARYFVNWGPESAQERMSSAMELRQHAERLGNQALMLDALGWISMELLERGDWPEADRQLARHGDMAEALRHPLHRSYAATWRATRATLDGRFAEAELAAHRAFALGQHLAELAFPRFNLQRFLIFREQGRLAELESDIAATAADYPQLPGWLIVAAAARLEHGDPTAALAVLAQFSATSRLPPDGNWLFGMALLAEISARLDERNSAAVLYDRLRPFDGRCVFGRFAPGGLGGVARHLGLLSAVQGDWERAEQHFTAAQRLHDRLGARPLSAWTRYDAARMLRARGGGAHLRRARSLLDEATAIAAPLGMTLLEERITEIEQPTDTAESRGPAAW